MTSHLQVGSQADSATVRPDQQRTGKVGHCGAKAWQGYDGTDSALNHSQSRVRVKAAWAVRAGNPVDIGTTASDHQRQGF